MIANGDGISLADIPADIIRKIIPMARNPNRLRLLNRLRMISPLWNSLTLQYLTQNTKPIDRVVIRMLQPHCDALLMRRAAESERVCNPQIVMTLDRDSLSHFKLTSAWTMKEIRDQNILLIALLSFSNKTHLDMMQKLFSSCSFIENVYMENVDNAAFDTILYCLGSVPIGTLKVAAKSEDVDSIAYKAKNIRTSSRSVFEM